MLSWHLPSEKEDYSWGNLKKKNLLLVSGIWCSSKDLIRPEKTIQIFWKFSQNSSILVATTPLSWLDYTPGNFSIKRERKNAQLRGRRHPQWCYGWVTYSTTPYHPVDAIFMRTECLSKQFWRLLGLGRLGLPQAVEMILFSVVPKAYHRPSST